MATLDGDWVCEQGGFLSITCFAVWYTCPTCNDGLVPAGQGIPIDEAQGNAHYEDRDQLRGKFDVCPDCTGSSGGYICGVHDVHSQSKEQA